MTANHPYLEDAKKLNALQDAVLDAVSAARDAISDLFDRHGHPTELLDNTLMRMCSYSSDRSQAVSYLVSAGFAWDGEIVLRSCYEANARIWFICLAEPSRRQALVNEFWGELADIHSYKRSRRAAAPRDTFKRHEQPQDETVFATLVRGDLQQFSRAGKKDKKNLEHKWSFTEIVQYLKKNPPDSFDLRDIDSLLHTYGLASHLVHADESALDLMLDRRLRPPAERHALAIAHVCRIFSDQVSLWMITAMTLAYRFEHKPRVPVSLRQKWENISTISQPFIERFYASQADFYACLESSNPLSKG